MMQEPFSCAGKTNGGPARPEASGRGMPEEALHPAGGAWKTLTRDLREVGVYARYYLAAKADGWRAWFKSIALKAGLYAVGAIAGAAVVVMAVVLLFQGASRGLGILFGDRFWLGELVTGAVMLLLAGLGVWLIAGKISGAWKSKLVTKYEQRKHEQRKRFGHDVAQRAAEYARRRAAKAGR